jgi:hypothetical protein
VASHWTEIVNFRAIFGYSSCLVSKAISSSWRWNLEFVRLKTWINYNESMMLKSLINSWNRELTKMISWSSKREFAKLKVEIINLLIWNHSVCWKREFKNCEFTNMKFGIPEFEMFPLVFVFYYHSNSTKPSIWVTDVCAMLHIFLFCHRIAKTGLSPAIGSSDGIATSKLSQSRHIYRLNSINQWITEFKIKRSPYGMWWLYGHD